MSKKFKSQASSSRAAAGGFISIGGFSSGFGNSGREPSTLTYIAEPPDLSRIPDQQLVVAFKNLLKKDEITRTKALDELRDYTSTVSKRGGTLDDGLLEAWVKVYPRASIDLSRRARQLAHLIQGAVSSLAGKRILPHLPKVVGAWLAGLYDNDRLVQRSALESFTGVFSTEAKRSNVWKIYQSSTLDFIDDVLLHQTSLTLSDERTTKRDDAEAKYSRVVGAALLLFNRIIGNSPDEDLQRGLPEIKELLGSKSLWAFCNHEDPFVRRSVYTLLRSAVLREPSCLDWKLISSAIIGKSLSIPQLGSASELSETILLLTSSRPQVWTEEYTGKTSASKRLRQYIQKGSQGGLGSFWSNLEKLLRIVPREVIAGIDKSATDNIICISSATALTEAFIEGLNSREEPRQNLTDGWNSYIQVGAWLVNLLPHEERADFMDQRLTPLVTCYVRNDPELAQWVLPPQSAEDICADWLATVASLDQVQYLQALWARLSDELLQAVKLSSPGQSKDFRPSQDSICGEAKRFFALQSAVLSRTADTDNEQQVQKVSYDTSLSLLESCLQVLHIRNGKPYGAAAVVDECARRMPSVAKRSPVFLEFIRTDAPDLLLSPSASRILAIILACRDWDGVATSFEEVAERALQLEPEQSNSHILQNLLASLNFNEFEDTDKISSLVTRAIDKACRGSHAHWQIITTVLQNSSSRGQLLDQIFLSIVDSLSMEDRVFETLHGLAYLGKSVPSAFKEFQHGRYGPKLIGKLLYLVESPSEDLAAQADSLVRTFKETVVGTTSRKSKIEILHHELSQATDESLSTESLFAIAEELMHDVGVDESTYTARDVLPSFQVWEEALTPFLHLPPRPSTSITSPLKGTVNLVKYELPESLKALRLSIPRDLARCTSAFRLTVFTIRVLSSFDIVSQLRNEDLETLLFFFPLAVQLVDDDLSIEDCNGISGVELADQREEYIELINQGKRIIASWMRATNPLESSSEVSIPSLLTSLWEQKLESLDELTPRGYRIGEVFVKMMSSADATQIKKSADQVSKLCREARSANAIRSASWFATLRSSILSNPAGHRVCNELVAESTGIKCQDLSSNGLRNLALLNILLSGEEDVVSTIPTQRLIFLTKHLIECLQSDMESLAMRAEIMQTLAYVIPALADIYGSHWEDIMEALIAALEGTNGGEEGLPVLMFSFRLFACLKSLAEGESNDDLQEVWLEKKTRLFNDVASTIRKFDSNVTFHQPRDVALGLLQRLLSVIPIEKLENVSEVFHLLTAHSRTVQRTAYTILHRFIPQAQEQVSFDVALSKTAVGLPDELMSLLLETPSMDMVVASYGDDKMWTAVRSYLLSWKVVFDHFTNASLPVQEFYAASIKEHDTLTSFLGFAFDFLQKSQGKIIDASRLDIRSFEPDQAENAEREIQWLLVHLYYLCLRYLANMTKTWWLDTKKRIKGPVEGWTERYISPIVVEDAIKNVTDWNSIQDPNEDRAMIVKVSPKTAEIVASITVDEESPPVAISIALPPAYPLHPAVVVGRSRVLVDEKTWKSWMLTIQGVIMFANGSLIDGLMAFRRNVQGALKGQSECAICYSVISTDMQTPNKRCATCKNTFHSVCLFRWFKSSNQSTCPLCRNNFVYV